MPTDTVKDLYTIGEAPPLGHVPARMYAQVTDCTPEELHIGMRVKAYFEPISDEEGIPKFRPAPSQTASTETAARTCAPSPAAANVDIRGLGIATIT